MVIQQYLFETLPSLPPAPIMQAAELAAKRIHGMEVRIEKLTNQGASSPDFAVVIVPSVHHVAIDDTAELEMRPLCLSVVMLAR